MPERVGGIEALLQEERTFPPPQEFRRQANAADPKVYEEAQRDPEGFWAKLAEELHWFEKWEKVLDWDPPHAQWFTGGKINVSYNCIDRHLTSGPPQQSSPDLGGGTRRLEGIHLWRPLPGGMPIRQRSKEPGSG